ncbi:MAG: phage tail assembly protein [Desulfarculus sp.]|nr:MAG: phage tail assembly protein [Desulfarculus sp.]
MSDSKPAAPAAPAGPAGPVKVALSRPIIVAGEQASEITIKEPLLKHFEVLDQLRLAVNDSGAMELRNLGSLAKVGAEQLAGLTPAEAAQITWPDMFKIAQAVMGFFGFSLPEIGATPSGR